MNRIHHIALRTRQVTELARFYAEWLGLPQVRDLAPRAIWLGLGADSVLMIEAMLEGEPAVPQGSLELIAFHVTAPERDALRAKLVAQERLEAETAHTLYFRDPDGRRVGVSSYPFG